MPRPSSSERRIPSGSHGPTTSAASSTIDGEGYKRELIEVLELWAERVWKPESLTITPILERDAEVKRDLLRELPIDQFVTTATNGVEFAPRPGIDRVVMVPSFVNRPLVSYLELGEALIIIYPVADESVSADADSPPAAPRAPVEGPRR